MPDQGPDNASTPAAEPSTTTGSGRPPHARWLLLAICAGVALAYGNVVFGGRSLLFSNAWNPLDQRPLARNYGPGFEPHETWSRKNLSIVANFHDPSSAWYQWEPAARELRRAWSVNNELPWWDPYIGGGTPGLANPTATPFFPPYLAMVLLSDSPAARTFYYLLLQAGAGAALGLLLLRHGVSRTAAGVGGLAFALSGGMAQNVGSMIGQTLSCAPFVLLATSYFFDRPNGRRGALLAVVYASTALSSFPPMVLAVFSFATLYAFLRLAEVARHSSWKGSSTVALRWMGAATLAIALASFYLLPVLELSRDSAYVAKLPRYRWAHALTAPAGNLVQLASPVLAGGEKVLQKTWLDRKGIERELPYVGAFVLGLAGLAAWPRRGASRCLGVLAIVSASLILLKALGVPPLSWISDLPMLRSVHFMPYFAHALGLPFAILAALGWDAISRRVVSRQRIGTALAGASIWIFVTWVVAQERGALARATSGRWLAELAVVAALLIGPCAVAVAVRRWGASSWRSSAVLALGLLLFMGEGIRNTWYPRQQRWDLWQRPPDFVAMLEDRLGSNRVVAYRTLVPNSGSALGIPQLESLMAFNAERMHALYLDVAAVRGRLFMHDAERLPPHPYLARAAVRFIAANSGAPAILRALEDSKYRKVFDDGFNSLYEVDTLPRHFFTTRYTVATAERARKVAARDRVVKRLWLEEKPSFRSALNRGKEPRIEVVEFRHNRYKLRLRAPRTGLVYCSESHMPGWSATVNGKPTPILAANYAFRAVEVQAGENVIEMSYNPPGLRFGLWCSAAGLAVLIALAALRPHLAAGSAGETAARGAARP